MDFNRCLSNLTKAGSDNEKMAAMLLVSPPRLVESRSYNTQILFTLYLVSLQAAKLIKSRDIGGEDRKKIFNAIGFNFLNRLFATSDRECSS